jgi:hypothetical protein
MKFDIMVTPEWVMEKLTQKYLADGKGNIDVLCNGEKDANLMKLALDSIGVAYESSYCAGLKGFYGIKLKMDDLQDGCPLLYQRLKNWNAKVSDCYK